MSGGNENLTSVEQAIVDDEVHMSLQELDQFTNKYKEFKEVVDGNETEVLVLLAVSDIQLGCADNIDMLVEHVKEKTD